MRQDQVLPDSTIWMRGGTYPIVFDGNSSTSFYGKGTPGHPLIIRNYRDGSPRGERVTITVDAAAWSSGFVTKGHDVWYWGIEFVQTQVPSPGIGDRITTTPGSNFGPDMSHFGSAFQTADGNEWKGRISNVKVINCILHDGAGGFTVQNASAPNFEAYGNLVYYNGSIGPDRGHGHGFYVQGSQSGETHAFRDNLSFHNFSHDFQAYGSSGAWENNMLLDGNILWGASDIHGDPAAQGGTACVGAGSCGGGGRELVVGGTNPATGLQLTNNMFYRTDQKGDQVHIGWSNWPAGSTGVGTVKGNYIATDLWLQNIQVPDGITMTGNTFITHHEADFPWNGYHTSDFPANTWSLPEAATTKVFVRPNAYEPTRGHVAIYNWARAATVAVDISPIVKVGAPYQVLFAMDYYGSPVVSGIYGGGTVKFPMVGMIAARPYGNILTPPSYLPFFAAFVVLQTGGVSSTPAPSPTRSATAIATPPRGEHRN